MSSTKYQCLVPVSIWRLRNETSFGEKLNHFLSELPRNFRPALPRPDLLTLSGTWSCLVPIWYLIMSGIRLILDHVWYPFDTWSCLVSVWYPIMNLVMRMKLLRWKNSIAWKGTNWILSKEAELTHVVRVSCFFNLLFSLFLSFPPLLFPRSPNLLSRPKLWWPSYWSILIIKIILFYFLSSALSFLSSLSLSVQPPQIVSFLNSFHVGEEEKVSLKRFSIIPTTGSWTPILIQF